MFGRISTKIKILAKILFGVLLAATVIADVLFVIEWPFSDEMQIGIIAAITAGGALLATVSSFALYGLGQLIEETQSARRETRETLDKILRTLDPNAGESPASEKETHEKEEKAKSKLLISTKFSAAETVRCLKCGKEQPKNRKTCSNCGAELDGKPEQEKFVACPFCGQSQDNSRTTCFRCGKPLVREDVLETTTADKQPPWTCVRCNTINDAESNFCLVCGAHRP